MAQAIEGNLHIPISTAPAVKGKYKAEDAIANPNILNRMSEDNHGRVRNSANLTDSSDFSLCCRDYLPKTLSSLRIRLLSLKPW